MCAFLSAYYISVGVSSCSLHLSVFSVPNVSFELYSPSFFEKFTESHAVMTQVCCTLVVMMVRMMVRILLEK